MANVYQRDANLRLTIWGRLFARDLAPIHSYMRGNFHKYYGIPITLEGARMFKRYVRQEMRPPRYPVGGDGKKRWAEPNTPSGGFGWYSGTLRRALHSRVARVGKYTVRSAMLPNHRKGWPPSWNRWGNKKNAYRYARWIEFGQVPNQPARPIMKMGFNKGKRPVADRMVKQTHAGFMEVVRRNRKMRMRIPGGVK